MSTNFPISQADLEAMRIGSSRAADEMEWMITVDAVSGHLQARTDFRRALVKAGLLQDNSNIQPLRPIFPFPYDFLFPPKETKNDKTESKRSSLNHAESDEQIRDSASHESDRECEIRKTTEIRISVSEAYWVLGMFKKFERIGLEINGASKPLLLRPEIRDFIKRIRQELRDIEDRVRMGNK